MKDHILKINIHRLDLKGELTNVMGIDVSDWDINEPYYENDKVVISWIGDYMVTTPSKNPNEQAEAVNKFPGFRFALVRYKGAGELDLKGSGKVSKLVEATPIRVFL